MTSGASATNSAAYLRIAVGIARAPAVVDPHVAALGPAQLLQALLECRERPDASGSSAARFMSTPMRRIRSGCCARAASGHAAAPPSSVMNSRRLIAAPEAQERHRNGSNSPIVKGPAYATVVMSALGHKRTCADNLRDVRFTPESGHCAARKSMSALCQ